ncbi:MAG TPA: hypothetical protein VK963_01470 [Candidatus Saccharimonadales bacterium]|nr:hypothetical protein [Candidatus Saccharimonadales bacterium]
MPISIGRTAYMIASMKLTTPLRHQTGKVFFKFLIWPSIILSILLTLVLNLIF